MKINKRNELGITLVALIVTIIIMLLLAGVTISQLTGSGLFKKATEAKEANEIVEIQEHIQLIVHEEQLKYSGNATTANIIDALEKDEKYVYEIILNETAILKGQKPEIIGNQKIYVVNKNYKYEVDEILKVSYIGKTNGNIAAELPENSSTTDAGTEVKLLEEWGMQTVDYVKTTDGTIEKKLQTVATVYAISDGQSNTIPVPKGFYYVGGTKTSGVVISDDERDKNKYAGIEDVPAGAIYNDDGTVVKYTDEQYKALSNEQKRAVLMGNQFVWVPCTADKYEKYNFGLYGSSWDTSTQDAEIGYIEKYGGFYIGRYEAGTSNLTSSTIDFAKGYGVIPSNWLNTNFRVEYITSGRITCKAGEIPYYHADYTTAREMTKAMYATDNERKKSVKSGIVTGTMWDVILNYFKAQDNTLDLTNSAWGNYKDTTLTNCKGRYIAVNSDNGVTLDIAQNTDGARHYGIMTCGSTEDVKKCNIYDVAGNLWEWTEEIAYDLSNTYYMLRGR